jgi:hypothetical protein
MQLREIKLSIIIVNFRSERVLEKCIASIYHTLFSSEVEIIVVNNDDKENLERIKRSFPEVILIESATNLGFGGASNLGAKQAKGKFLLFLNPDTRVLATDWRGVEKEFKDDSIGVIGARLVTSEGKNQDWSAGGKLDFWDVLRNNLGFPKNKKIWRSGVKKRVFWVSGTAMFIRRDIFKILEGFDENIFMYFEDIDFCARVRKLDKKVLYYPDFSVLHLGGESYRNQKTQKKHYYDSQSYYFQKHCTKPAYYAIKGLRLLLGK